eukprot:9485686-Pyramimonas_sp.AAC.2
MSGHSEEREYEIKERNGTKDRLRRWWRRDGQTDRTGARMRTRARGTSLLPQEPPTDIDFARLEVAVAAELKARGELQIVPAPEPPALPQDLPSSSCYPDALLPLAFLLLLLLLLRSLLFGRSPNLFLANSDLSAAQGATYRAAIRQNMVLSSAAEGATYGAANWRRLSLFGRRGRNLWRNQ